MKKKFLGMTLSLAVMVIFVSCASTGTSTTTGSVTTDSNAAPASVTRLGGIAIERSILATQLNENESLVIINRESANTGAMVYLQILIDWQPAALVNNGSQVGIPVINGKHTVTTVNQASGVRSNELEFEANSIRIVISTGFGDTGLFVKKVYEEPLP